MNWTNSRRILGSIVFVIGVALLVFGINKTQKIGEKVHQEITGHYSDNTTVHIVSGVVLILGGLALGIKRHSLK